MELHDQAANCAENVAITVESVLSWRWWGGEQNTGFLVSAVCVLIFHFWLVTARIVRHFNSVTQRQVTVEAVIAALLSLSFFLHLSTPLGLQANTQIGWIAPPTLYLAVPIAVYWIMSGAWGRHLTRLRERDSELRKRAYKMGPLTRSTRRR